MLIRTTVGDVPEEMLTRIVGLEERPTELVIWVAYHATEKLVAALVVPPEVNELVRRDTFSCPKDLSPEVDTTLGKMPVAQLRRTLELTDTDTDISVATVYRLNDEIVHRSVWVIVKQGAEAVGVAASVG